MNTLKLNMMRNIFNIEYYTFLKQINNKYLQLFSCTNKDDLVLTLKKLNHDAGSVCARKMIKIGGWKCVDCEKNSNAILCHQCWSKIKDKHLNHDINFHSSTNGTCDCGDPNTLQNSLFCPNHKGPLTNEKEVEKYINKFFSQDLVQSFQTITENLLEKMIPYIVDNIENKIKDKNFISTMNQFLEMIDMLSINTALMHILSKIFLKNFKIKVKHNCLMISDNEIKFIKTNEEHECCCPIIRFLMASWCYTNQDVLFRFLLNYKLRKTMGILYFLLYEYFVRFCHEEFCELSVQYIFDDVCTTVATTPGLIEFYFESLIKIFRYFSEENYIPTIEEECPLFTKINNIENQQTFFLSDLSDFTKFSVFNEIAKRIAYDSLYFIKPESAKYLGNNESIYLKLIELFSVFHNINSIKAFYPHKLDFYKESYNTNIVITEYYLLMIFDAYISILNFENKIMVQNIFNYFSDIIVNKKYRQLDKNEYSFHCILYRAFSIFLNRYIFYYINSINIQDINVGFENAIKYIPNFQIFGEIIINDLLKVFGFVNACRLNFLNYYGELMPNIETYYFQYNEFILRDSFLLRFLLSNNNFKLSFSLLNIFKTCSLENTFNLMEDLFLSKENVPPDENFFKEEDNEKYMKFNGQIIKIILNLIRDNKSILWTLGSSHQVLKNTKFSNSLVKKIISNDEINIKEICKNIIINQIVSNENLDNYTDIMDNIYFCFKDIIGEEKIEELILSMSNKTLTLNKKAKFSIKDEYLKYLDINSIFFSKQKSNIQKYINNFKKEKISIYNDYFYPFTKYEINSQKNIEKNFFMNQENFDIMFKMTELLLTNEKYFIFQEFFLNEIINYWNIFFYISKENRQEYMQFIYQNKSNIEKLVNILSNNTLNDNSLKNFCFSVIEKIAQNDLFINLKSIQNINIIQLKNLNQNKPNKNSVKGKIKNKFKSKFLKLENVYDTKSIKNTEKKIFESCIYCLKPIEENNISNLYGKVGNVINDFLFLNSFKQTIKKEFKKYNKKNSDFQNIIIQIYEEQGINIYSCNHFIHYSCFTKLFKNDTHNDKCPLCHQQINLLIPSLCQYNNEDIFYKLKGYNLSEKPKEESLLNNVNDNNKFIISLSEEEKNCNIKESNKINNPINLIIFSKEFLFSFIKKIEFKINHKSILTKMMIVKFSKAMSDFFDFIENYNNYKNKIEYFKNLILSIRILTKENIFVSNTIFSILIELFNRLLVFGENIFDNRLKNILSQIELIICILFDYETIAGYEKYIMKIFLPIFVVQYFARNLIINNGFIFNADIFKNNLNISQFILFLNNDKSVQNVLKYIAKNIFLVNLLIRKNENNCDNNTEENISFELNYLLDKIGFSDYKSKSLIEIITIIDSSKVQESNKKSDLFFSQFVPILTISQYLQKLSDSIDNYMKQRITPYKYISPYLLGSCLSIEYQFINLCPLALDFQFLFFEIPCIFCKKCGYPSFICLTCGKKLCNQKESKCTIPFPLIEHNTKCGGGRSIYINTFNYKAVLVDYNNEKYELDIPFYSNKFGEIVDDYTTSKDIKLNKDEIYNALKIFINYSWTNYQQSST